MAARIANVLAISSLALAGGVGFGLQDTVGYTVVGSAADFAMYTPATSDCGQATVYSLWVRGMGCRL